MKIDRAERIRIFFKNINIKFSIQFANASYREKSEFHGNSISWVYSSTNYCCGYPKIWAAVPVIWKSFNTLVHGTFLFLWCVHGSWGKSAIVTSACGHKIATLCSTTIASWKSWSQHFSGQESKRRFEMGIHCSGFFSGCHRLEQSAEKDSV